MLVPGESRTGKPNRYLSKQFVVGLEGIVSKKLDGISANDLLAEASNDIVNVKVCASPEYSRTVPILGVEPGTQ
jgi:hypothetical protein